MKHAYSNGQLGYLLIALVFVVAALTGCTTTGNLKNGGDKYSSTESQPQPLYLDFGDVLIPAELDVDKKASFVFRNAGFSAGVLSLKGRVEMTSLIAFFENNMAADNWKLVTAFKSPRTIMLFKKETRWCVINITDGDFTTHIEIWVAPSLSEELLSQSKRGGAAGSP